MVAAKKPNSFVQYQAAVVDTHLKRIEAELKDIRSRSKISFETLNALVRYISKVTGMHRTTLKRNTTYRTVLRDFLVQQSGATTAVVIADASPELLRAMVEEQRLTIANLTQQVQVLKARFATMDAAARGLLTQPVVAENPVDVTKMYTERDFQDTAMALWQLIQHLNHSTGVETIVIDEDAGLIMDAAIPNPRKRRELAIGPERTKPFIAWYKANKKQIS